MKKHYILILIISLLIGGLITSCYDDKSTLDANKISGVMIDTTGMSKLSVFQFENLVVNPKLILEDGLSETHLSYTWEMNIDPGDTIHEVISTEKNLNYEVLLKPNEGNQQYQLVLIVTDQSTDLDYIMSWPTLVKNSLGEGLVIAETDDDMNTDLSLIMSSEVTTDFTGTKILNHVFSTNNGGNTMEGLIKQMRFTNIFGKNVLLAITDNSIYRVNTFDYAYGGSNEAMFFAHSGDYAPQLLGGMKQGDIYVGSGRLTGVWLGVSHKFGLPFDFPYTVPDHVAINGKVNPPIAINFFDEDLEGFVYLPTIAAWGDRNMYEIPSASDKVFDPAAIPNKINVAAGVGVGGDFLHLLKDKTTGDMALYVLDGGVSIYPDLFPPNPKALYDLSDAPDIENATKFVFLDNQKVMFYATSDKIYAMLYATSVPTFEERYTVPAGEEITTLQVYNQVGYPWASSYIETNNKQLIMSTYGSEGKVYLLPFINLGAANIDVNNIKIFDGFGRITAITPQK